jgi:hypothetical protein
LDSRIGTMARAPKQSKEPTRPEPPARRNRVAAIGLDAGQLAQSAFARAGFADPSLVLRWDEIVGPDIARFAQPLKLSESASGATLTLKADPAAAIFLQHESRALCGRINAYLGRPVVQRLRFVSGQVTSARALPAHRSRKAPSREPNLAFSGCEKLRVALLALAHARAGDPQDGGD